MFVHFNPNPFYSDEIVMWNRGDCVIRAISCILGYDWDKAYNFCYSHSKDVGDVPNSSTGFKELMRVLNMECIIIGEKSKINVKEFAKKHSNEICIVSIIGITGHVLCTKNGNYYDAFDTGKELVYGYHIYKEEYVEEKIENDNIIEETKDIEEKIEEVNNIEEKIEEGNNIEEEIGEGNEIEIEDEIGEGNEIEIEDEIGETKDIELEKEIEEVKDIEEEIGETKDIELEKEIEEVKDIEEEIEEVKISRLIVVKNTYISILNYQVLFINKFILYLLKKLKIR